MKNKNLVISDWLRKGLLCTSRTKISAISSFVVFVVNTVVWLPGALSNPATDSHKQRQRTWIWLQGLRTNEERVGIQIFYCLNI